MNPFYLFMDVFTIILFLGVPATVFLIIGFKLKGKRTMKYDATVAGIIDRSYVTVDNAKNQKYFNVDYSYSVGGKNYTGTDEYLGAEVQGWRLSDVQYAGNEFSKVFPAGSNTVVHYMNKEPETSYIFFKNRSSKDMALPLGLIWGGIAFWIGAILAVIFVIAVG